MPTACAGPLAWSPTRTCPCDAARFPTDCPHALDGADLCCTPGTWANCGCLTNLRPLRQSSRFTATTIRVIIANCPYQQIVVAGTRILLWHSHYADWPEEMASRKDDDPRPKLQRCSERALRAGATVCVFGHWHIPLTYEYKGEYKGVLIVNPGAIASGNEITRQLRQTAAVLFVDNAGRSAVTHVDLADPDRPYTPPKTRGIQAFSPSWRTTAPRSLRRRSRSSLPYLRQHLSEGAFAQIRPILLQLARRVWDGELPSVGYEELTAALEANASVTDEVRRQFLEVMANRPAT